MSPSHAAIHAECVARSAEEDALFDQYWALPDRPRLFLMMRTTETDQPYPTETIDMDHWAAWYAARTKLPMPSLERPSPGLWARICKALW